MVKRKSENQPEEEVYATHRGRDKGIRFLTGTNASDKTLKKNNSDHECYPKQKSFKNEGIMKTLLRHSKDERVHH